MNLSTMGLRERALGITGTATDVAALFAVSYPQKHDDLRGIAVDVRRDVTARIIAVDGLERMGSVAASSLGLLAENGDHLVRTEAILAYGRIASTPLGPEVCGPAARFTNALIAARHGLHATLPTRPAPAECDKSVSTEARTRRANRAELESIESLGAEALGIVALADATVVVEWPTIRWILALDAAGIAEIVATNAPSLRVAGVIAEEGLYDDGDYFCLAYLLASKDAGTITVAAFSPDGVCTAIGEIVLHSDGPQLSLRPTVDRDALPIALNVALRGSCLLAVDRATLLEAAGEKHVAPRTRGDQPPPPSTIA